MKFGIRECCDVVFRAKAAQQIGNKKFYKGEPVIYFDTLKTSTLEGAATTVYAQGGKGNSRLMAWEGERTLTFTMEDALISPEGISILTGAGIVEASSTNKISVHATETISIKKLNEGTTKVVTNNSGAITIASMPFGKDEDTGTVHEIDKGAGTYVMITDEYGNVITEPLSSKTTTGGAGKITVTQDPTSSQATISTDSATTVIEELKNVTNIDDYMILVDYYITKTSGAYQIDITPDKFGGYFYVEGDTLFRDQATGVDMPAQIVIPNAKVQSNFTFAMSGSGDPSTFTFTLDAFPGYINGGTKKVLATIQVVRENGNTSADGKRPKTDASVE